MTQETFPNLENIISLNIQEICLDRKLGVLNFQDCVDPLKKIRDWAEKFKNLNVDPSLDEHWNGPVITKFFTEIFQFCQEIKIFDPTETGYNAKYRRDEISQKLRTAYNNSRQQIAQAMLFAEMISKLRIADEKLVKIDAAKDVSKIKKSLLDYSDGLNMELSEEYKNIKDEISSLKSAQATDNLSQHFSKHSKSYDAPIKTGLKKVLILRSVNYCLPVIAFASIASLICVKGGIDKSFIPIAALFSIGMSLVFYHLKQVTRDLNILRNAKESYEHRAKVAETFVAFLTSETKDEITKSEMAKQAAIAMFQRVPNGYLTKDQIEPINHPLAEILIKRK
jgi:hypothetical protein